MEWRKLIPAPLRKLILKGYAMKMYNDAVEIAERKHREDEKGRRYFVIGTKYGDLKVVNVDEETRMRRNDPHPLTRSIRRPYKLRRQSFYYTASKVCTRKYQPQGMTEWEKEEHLKLFIEWYFRMH